jgi:hypothetical protein
LTPYSNHHQRFDQSKPQEAKEAKIISADETDTTSWLHLQYFDQEIVGPYSAVVENTFPKLMLGYAPARAEFLG